MQAPILRFLATGHLHFFWRSAHTSEQPQPAPRPHLSSIVQPSLLLTFLALTFLDIWSALLRDVLPARASLSSEKKKRDAVFRIPLSSLQNQYSRCLQSNLGGQLRVTIILLLWCMLHVVWSFVRGQEPVVDLQAQTAQGCIINRAS